MTRLRCWLDARALERALRVFFRRGCFEVLSPGPAARYCGCRTYESAPVSVLTKRDTDG